MTTIQEFASKLNGREYRSEITYLEEQEARELGYVVVYGYSDDCVEFAGAIHDEIDCYGGKEILIDENGILSTDCGDCSDCKLFLKHKILCKSIQVVWGEGEYCWTYKTDIPHVTFDIYEDGDKYCKGIVFDMKDIISK